MVEYWYDAWGKPTGTISTLTTDLAYLNPFRYRGYVYDEETRLYYLRSRYYDAWIGRFVNSDNTTGQIGGTLNHNLFVYCKSVPVCCADPSGKSLISAILSLFQIKKAISKSGMKVTGRTIQTNKGNYSIYSPKPKGYAELWPQHFKLNTIAYGKSTIRVSSLYEFIKPLGKLELSNEDNYASPVATLFTGFVDYLSSVVEGSVYCTLETKIVQNGNNDSSAIMNMTVAQKVWNYSKGGYDDHQLGSVSILGFENGVVEIPIYNDRLGAFIVYSFSDEAGIMKALIEGMELEYY